MEKELIILVGPIGSGKTTFAETLKTNNSVRISQDEMGRKAYLAHFEEALDDDAPRIIIDRMNFNKSQRERFITPAREAGYCVTIFEMKVNRAVCHERVVKRTDHPTIEAGNNDLTASILNMFEAHYEAPDSSEYDNFNIMEET